MSIPRVSVFMTVRNGMPYLSDAIASVAAQTFTDFELVVQDGGSTDGTREYLESVDSVARYDLISEPDSGISQGANRALARCRGEIVGSIDADNMLEPDALEHAVAFLDAHPDVAVAYGGCNMVDADGVLLYPWMPNEFNLLDLLNCELVPPFSTSFFVRGNVEGELRIDESIETVPDFDLWLRLSRFSIRRIDRILGRTRLNDSSGTRRSETYDSFIRDKHAALERYLAQFESNPVFEAVRCRALAGACLWAAESVYDIEGGRTERFERYLRQAEELDPTSERASRARLLAQDDPSKLPPTEEASDEPSAAPLEPTRWSRLTSRVRRSNAGFES
jgi:glycosyltransferase involved in cell wall biosynthesis